MGIQEKVLPELTRQYFFPRWRWRESNPRPKDSSLGYLRA